MEDIVLYSTRARDIWLFKTLAQAVRAGVFLGAIVGLVVGAVMGAAVGWYNEATLTGDDYEELFAGFGEYSMQGMSIGCAIICAIYGSAASVAASASAWTSRRRSVGVIVGLALPLGLCLATDLFHDCRKQAGFVWCAGMLTGSVTAGLLCARGKEMSRRPTEHS